MTKQSQPKQKEKIKRLEPKYIASSKEPAAKEIDASLYLLRYDD